MCGEGVGCVGVACTCWEVASVGTAGVGGALRRAAWGVGRRARRRCMGGNPSSALALNIPQSLGISLLEIPNSCQQGFLDDVFAGFSMAFPSRAGASKSRPALPLGMF